MNNRVNNSPTATLGKRQKYASVRLADPAWLRERYISAGQTQQQIAAELDTSQAAVHRALRQHGIHKRSRTTAAIAETFDEFATIIDEMTAQLRKDKARHPPGWVIVGRRVRLVSDAAQHKDEKAAQRQALIELASAAILTANHF